MNGRAQAGLIKIVLGVAIVALWMRGYLSAGLDAVANAVQTKGGPIKVPFGPPGAHLPAIFGTPQGAGATAATSSGFTLPVITPVTTHPGRGGQP